MSSDPVKLNDLEHRIVAFCVHKAYPVKELADKLAIPAASGEMKRAITRLLQLKFIEYTTPDFYRSYSQRYRTTSKGKEYLSYP